MSTEILPLHGYQKRAVKACNLQPKLFLAIGLGLGKTRIVIEATKDSTLPTLVIAPLRVTYLTWPEELEKWAPDKKWLILHGPDKKDLVGYKTDYYLINYDGLKWFFEELKKPKYRGLKFNLVLDESSMIKSPTTMRFKMLRKNLHRFPAKRYCLSATPAPNSLIDLWSQYFMLDEGERLKPVFGHFRNIYFHYSGPPFYKTTLKKGADVAIQDKVKDITFRLDSKDYNKMPPLRDNSIPVELPPSVMKQYKQLEKDFFLELAEDESISAVTAATLSMKLRQFVQGAVYNDDGGTTLIHREKIKALRELVDSSAGHSILCPIQFKFELALLRKEFGDDTPAIVGGVKASEAANIKKQWNRGNIPLLLCHPASVSHGLNLQAGGHTLCWYGLTWSLEHYHQLIGRLHRQGQTHGVIAHHLVARNTIDEKVMKTLATKDATQQSFLDAMRAHALRSLEG